LSVFLFVICITLLVVSGCNYHRWPAMMEFFLSGSLPLTDFVICDVMSDMANKLLSLSLSLSRLFFHSLPCILPRSSFPCMGVDHRLDRGTCPSYFSK